MLSRILVPMDDSEMARRALEYALENHPDAEIVVLHVVGEPTPWGAAAMSMALEGDLEAAAEERAEDVFEGAREFADEYGVEVTTRVRLGHPARAIVNAAEEFDAVVIGTHGGTLAERLVAGNVARRVFRQSPVTVIVAR